MSKFKLLICAVVLLISTSCFAAYKWTWETGTNPDLLNQFMTNPDFASMSMDTITLANGWTIDNATDNALEFNENGEDLILTVSTNAFTWSSTLGTVTMGFGAIVPTANQFLFTPVSAAVGSVEGTVYYDSDDDNLYVRTTAGLVDLTATSTSTMDDIYNNSSAALGVTVDVGPIVWTAPNANDKVVMSFVQADTSTTKAITITNAGTGNTIDIEGQATGKDIEGTGDTWNVTGAGAGTFASLTTTAAGTIGTTLGVGTNLTVTGDATVNGNTIIGNANSDTLTVVANIYLDDTSGASPSIIFTDGTDETATIAKVDTGYTTVTTTADDGLQILTGNLKVGNGTPSVTLDGEDVYIEGTFENLGGATFTGAVSHTSTASFTGDVTLDDQINGTFASNDEEIAITGTATNVTAANLMTLIMAAQDSNKYILALQQTPNGDAQNHYLVCEDNAGGTDLFKIENGGDTTWTLDAAANVVIDGMTTVSTTTGGVLAVSMASATTTGSAVYVDVTSTVGSGEISDGININLDDDTGAAGSIRGVYIASDDVSGSSVIYGLVTANSLDSAIYSTMGAAATWATVDAATTDSTLATGVLDIDWDSKTAGAEAVNIKATHLTGGSGQTISALEIELDADSGNVGDTLQGIYINASDVTATGFIDAIHVGGGGTTAMRAALQADFGYVRVGTGSTPGITPGDDDVFIEGTLEADGVVQLDGGTLNLGNGIVVTTAEDNKFKITENSDTLGLNFGSDIIELGSCGTGIATLDLNDIDKLVDVESIAGDYGQMIDFSAGNERVEFGDTEKIGFNLNGGTNIVELCTDSGVATLDFNDIDWLDDIECLDSGTDARMKWETNSKTQKRIILPISYVSATEIRLAPPGFPALCVGLTGVDWIGSALGYVTIGDTADILNFGIQIPDDFIDGNAVGDLKIEFDMLEVAGEDVDLVVSIYDYNDTTADISDTITITNGASRGWVGLVTLSTGIGTQTCIDPEAVLLVSIIQEGADNAEDVQIYGVRLTYTTGIENTQ